MVHVLRCHPGPFREIKQGLQRFVYRDDDRNYQAGQQLQLREWAPEDAAFTGDELLVEVLQLIRGPAFDLARGKVIMSIAPISLPVQVKGDLAAERFRRDGQGTERL